MSARHQHEIERQRMEVERVRRELDAMMARLRAEMQAALEEFDRALERAADPLPAARTYRDRCGAWPLRKPNRRPRRGSEGGEPIPVKPRPKPTPLVDGAEAPIE
jgi:hypothetical protein